MLRRRVRRQHLPRSEPVSRPDLRMHPRTDCGICCLRPLEWPQSIHITGQSLIDLDSAARECPACGCVEDDRPRTALSSAIARCPGCSVGRGGCQGARETMDSAGHAAQVAASRRHTRATSGGAGRPDHEAGFAGAPRVHHEPQARAIPTLSTTRSTLDTGLYCDTVMRDRSLLHRARRHGAILPGTGIRI